MEQGLAQHKHDARIEKESFATRDELARWFFEFYSQQFEAFLARKEVFTLPDQFELRDAFNDPQTSPLQKVARWRDVTETSANELIRWLQFARTRFSALDVTSFLQCIDQEWMHWSPNILTEVSPSASVVFLGHVIAHEDLRRAIGHHAIGESNYTTSFGVDEVTPFLERVEKLSGANEQQLITLLALPPLVAQAQAESYSEDRAGMMLPEAIRRWGRNPDRSILQRLVAQQISAELSPTGTPIHAEQAPLAQNTLYVSELGLDTPVVRIARDTVGVFNDVGFLQEIAPDPEGKVHTDSVNETNLRAYAKQQERLSAIRFLQQNIDLPRSATQTEIDKLAHAHTILKELPDLAVPESLHRWIELATTIYEAQKAYATATNQRERASIERRFEAAIGEWRANRSEFFQLRHQVETFISSVIEASVQQFGLMKVQGDLLEKQLAKNPAADTEKQAGILRVIHHPSTRAVLEQRLSFPLAELSLREQLRFGEWLLSTNEAAGAATLNIVKRFGPNAARTFLALETDAKNGERILAIANQADPAVAARVFEAFARIADKIDLSAQDLAKHLYKDNGHEVDTECVRQELIKRGSRILMDAEKILIKDPDGASVIGVLQRYEADTLLFASLFSSAFKGKEASFEIVRDLEIQTCELGDLSAEDRIRMKQLLDQEWSKKPLEFLFPESGSFRFFLLRRCGQIEGFMRFEDQSSTSRHANFLCVDRSLRGSGIGENVLREAIFRAGRSVTLHAEFDAAIPAGSMYIERFGFVGTGIDIEDRDGILVEWVRIERSDALLKQLPSRSATPEQLRHWAKTEAPTPYILTTLEGPASTMEVGVLAALKQAHLKNPNYVLSRYLLEPLGEGRERRILVFDLPTPATSPSATKTQTTGGAAKRSRRPESPTPHRDRYAE